MFRRRDTQSWAIKRRSRCGSVRGCPVLSSHFSPGSRATSRATYSLYLFESSLFAHLGLRFRGNGHGSTLQEADDQCAIYLQAAVVADEALLPEPIHKFTYPCAGGTDHLRQGCLAHLQGVLRL